MIKATDVVSQKIDDITNTDSDSVGLGGVDNVLTSISSVGRSVDELKAPVRVVDQFLARLSSYQASGPKLQRLVNTAASSKSTLQPAAAALDELKDAAVSAATLSAAAATSFAGAFGVYQVGADNDNYVCCDG